ncbi:hypothetical protein [Streptococcus suis]|uniref:hypothetical protein n=1 Tax=Streptococcus suis TaxID=1307 RepID=UPI001C953F1D|nr:hypothetical protein [Streptococcus suis]MBY5009415.1 hypothetical protein [Streptococcus suis]MDG4518764.1 hypothetical protein [Streptococcus suis]
MAMVYRVLTINGYVFKRKWADGIFGYVVGSPITNSCMRTDTFSLEQAKLLAKLFNGTIIFAGLNDDI